ncbi:MAG: extracellular solute-binding protein [Gammaproteobacteria bacterium]|jgi:iron(III) transport system substrate-binding protein|nr:extracellular solute-binding protein [Gammaproteobacteria bacterium]
MFPAPVRRLALLLACALVLPTAAHAAEVVVYSARVEPLIKPLFDAYTKETGVDVRFATDKEGPLLARLQAEGENTQADVLLTVDAGNLWQAAEAGVLRPVDSAVLRANVPAQLRDPGDRWFGLAIRARALVYSPERVKPDELVSYEDLASPKWKGRLCLRTSKKVYNQSLVAMMIARLGEAKAEEIVKGWVANLATEPLASDNQVIEAIDAGKCDVGVVNTYYFGRLLEEKPGLKVRLAWPDKVGPGVHVNISGAGVTRHAKHPAEAQQLLEWLSSPKAQGLFASLNLEFPVNPAVPADPKVTAWGPYKADPANVADAGRLQKQAVMLMDRAGYR